ncbi:MAG: GTP cyclohydrolase, FolE2/MptA family [Candidatus Levybacteria bacterium]|nr:GTP cyclohydrolase, FolE2/MptA family [Candidatus Levybacteria bacterium]
MQLKDILKKSFVDIPSSKPKIELPLDYVGISNRPHYITIIDPFNVSTKVTLLAQIRIMANLPKNQRGLHMSRFETALHQLDQIKPTKLDTYSENLCSLVRDSQFVDICKVEITADYEKNVKEKNLSCEPSHELITLKANAEVNKNIKIKEIGVAVPFFNACPCTQRWGMRDFYTFLKTKKIGKILSEELIKNAPFQAHTNRGILSLTVRNSKINYMDIYRILEKTSPIIRELLKGKDEHALVKKGHALAMFCEDVAREAALNTYLYLSTEPDKETQIKIKVDADESVHFHNLICEIDTTLRELASYLKNGNQ